MLAISLVFNSLIIAQCEPEDPDCIAGNSEFVKVGTPGQITYFSELIMQNCILDEGHSESDPQFILIQGTLAVDDNVEYTFAAGSIILFDRDQTDPESNLIIEGTLHVYESEFKACTYMWNAMTVATGGILDLNGSWISGSIYGIVLKPESYIYSVGNHFFDNYLSSIYATFDNPSNAFHYISENDFDGTEIDESLEPHGGEKCKHAIFIYNVIEFMIYVNNTFSDFNFCQNGGFELENYIVPECPAILASNSNLEVSGSDFVDNVCSIWHISDNLNSSFNCNQNNITTTDLDYINQFIGIVSLQAATSVITDNVFSNLKYGMGVYRSIGTYTIGHNEFTNISTTNVVAGYNFGGGEINNENEISLTQNNEIDAWTGIYARNNIGWKYKIEDNIIETDDNSKDFFETYGVRVFNSPGIEILGNDIDLNSAPLCVFCHKYGLLALNSSGTKMLYNTINGTITNQPYYDESGTYVVSSLFSEVKCNSVQNYQHGSYFKANCDLTYLTQNHYNDDNIGVLVAGVGLTNGVIGEQKHQTNSWGTIGSYDIAYGLSLSPFIVETNSGQYYPSPVLETNVSVITETPTNKCFTNTPPREKLSPLIGKTVYGDLLAVYDEWQTGFLFDANYSTIKSLLTFPDLLDSTIAYNYLQDTLNSPEYKLNLVEKGLYDYLQDSSNYGQLNVFTDTLTKYLSYYRDTLENAYPINNLQEFLDFKENVEVLLDTVEQWLDRNSEIGIDFSTNLNSQLSSLIEDLNEIETETEPQSNMKKVLGIIINHSNVTEWTEFDETEELVLDSIADQCLAEGGNAVLISRILLNRDLFVAEDECEPESLSKNGNNPISTDYVILQQNTGIIVLNNPKDPITKIRVFDVQGRLINENSYDRNAYYDQITLKNLSSGMYFIQVNGHFFKKIF
ncbi:MAG: T9SS type A sorting domain-containing protein [Saprospiraceae bacterium]|nr:T9SS type A sorting domain-containing protein [Saprospiraceae bacterium]MBK9728155.1 T9SS type A sorting domain-containing protein [Saprospiraceae bacterium]